MMIDYELRIVRDTFANLFVLALKNKFHPYSFTYYLEKSEFLLSIEKDIYPNCINKSLEELFFDITGQEIKGDYFGVYNDAYWCGIAYFELHMRLNKSFSYLFLKLPLVSMLDLYNVYHEMDISSLVQYFSEIEKKKTILRLLIENKKISVNDLSKATGINLNTLIKYSQSDDALYNASFQNIIKLVDYFDTTINLFVRK